MSQTNGDDGLITVQELLHRIDAACDGMGDRNPHKSLFRQCAVAISNLASRLPEGPQQTRGGLILP